MNRIDRCFGELKSAGRKALIPFITAGDPDFATTLSLMHGLVEAGADILELGVPFSDPMADGPVIQAASERALAGGASLAGVLETVAEFRRHDTTTPVVLMGYLNPIEAMGYATFVDRAAAAGVDGVLMVDMIPEEAADVLPLFHDRDLHPIFLVAPTTGTKRLSRISQVAGGYLYYVSLKGVTGSDAIDVSGIGAKVTEIQSHSPLPVAVGFGIRDAATAAAVAQVADAVVVGSALVARIAEYSGDKRVLRDHVCELLRTMRQAMDRGR